MRESTDNEPHMLTPLARAAKLLAAPALAAALLAACGFETTSGRTMGTTYAIQADCPGPLPTERIEAELDDVVRRMSTYESDSELMAFNRAPAGEEVAVSPPLAEVVAAAQRIAEQTEGAFDVTVAPLVSLWGFGAAPAAKAPSAASIRAAKATVGHHRLRAVAAPPSLRKLAPVALDLSALAKGHAVDRLAAALSDAGCVSFLIELGGEIRVAGPSPSGGRWRLGVESPFGDQHIGPPIALRAGAVATSGDYRQYRMSGGERVSHVIDPRTGRPIAHRLASVTVVADTAMLADAYATALLVLGEADGKRFAERNGIAALFVQRVAGADEFETSQSTAMNAYRASPR